ncbi:MAG: HAMP domain-containing protein, partial [Nitrospirae bacterium]|nr:HAMP domain-containing protein [Nitrospirota bacterium]
MIIKNTHMQIKHIKQNLIFFKGKSLTFRLALWFIFISLIPLIILGFSFFSVAQDSLLRHIYSELNTISNLKKHQIETYAIERKNDIEVLAHSLLLQQAINSFSQVFNKDGVNSPKYHAIEQKFKPFFERHLNNFEKYDAVLISPSGDVIYSMLSNKELGTNLISGQFKDSILSEVYKKSIENPNMIVQSEIGFFQPTNRIEILITATVMDKSTPIGVLAIVLDANEFLLKSSDFNSLGKTGEVILVEKIDNRAIIVSPLRFDPYDTYKRNIIIGSQDAIPLQKAVSGEHGYGQFIDYRGKDVLAVWNHLKLNGKGIIVKIDKDEAYAPIYHLKHLFIAISIFLISTLVIVIFLLSKSISKPIISLTNTTRVIAQGNYTHEVKMNSHDEIGILADSINVMAQNLKIKEEQHIRFEAELSAQKDALDDAQRIAHIGNWSWNINDNTVLWSKEMYNIYGVDIRTFKPDYDSIKRFIHPEDIHKSDEILYDNKKFRSDDYRIILEDGTIRYISAFVEVKFNEDFKGIYLVGTSQDITARKQLEIELYNHMHLLAQQSKMASMGEMLGAIAHQWRQPLNAINLIIQDLADAFKFGELD